MADADNKKDAWDRLTALASILVPAAIGLTGYFISDGLKQAELENEKHRAEQSYAIAEANKKIAQASLVKTLIESLTSENPQERKLAVAAVLIGLPEEGPAFVRITAASDNDASVQSLAKDSLLERVDQLIIELFSDNRERRTAAAKELTLGFRNEAHVVSALVNYAKENQDNANGIYNTVVVLSEFSLPALKAHEQELLEFAGVAAANGPNTKAKVDELLNRYRVSTTN